MDGHELRRTLDIHKLISRIYADDRFPKPGVWGDLRMLAVTIVWVTGIERPPKGERWKRICEAMHLDNRRFWYLIAEDAPRFEPDRGLETGLCEAPMIRRDGPCGRPGNQGFPVTNPLDGTWRVVRFCIRHREYADQVRAAERARVKAGRIPEPLPNRGGLLPCYVNSKWPDNYANAKPGWKPPQVGICADDWPVMAKVVEAEPPTLPPSLKVIHGGVERDAPAIPSDGSTAPALKLIRSDQ